MVTNDQHPPAAVNQPLLGRVFLVVEDNTLIAMDVQNAIIEAGAFDVFDPTSPEEIEALLSDCAIDLAIIDVNLDDANRFLVAERAAALGLPVIFTSGYSHEFEVPAALRCAPILSKPFTMSRLVSTAAVLLKR